MSILPLLAIILSNQFHEVITPEKVKKYVGPDSISTASYIENNVSRIVTEYNNIYAEIWKASYVDNKIRVVDTTTGLEYMFLDFDNSNGYALIGFDYSFLDFSINGNLDFLNNLEVCYWNKYDGYVYEQNGKFIPYANKYLNEDELNSISYNYSGQENDAKKYEGITNISSYLTDRYGGTWNLDSSKTLSNYVDVVQDDYGFNEGNCTLSAFYGIFRYLNDYKSMGLSKKYTKYSYNGETKTIPVIYEKLYNNACNYSYSHEKGSNAWTSTTMAIWGNAAINEFKKCDWWKSYCHLCILWSFSSEVKNNIDTGYPVMWNQANGKYGGHSMVVKGYEIWSKTTSWWIFKSTETKRFLTINNNWNRNYTNYLDYDSYSSLFDGGTFGTFTVCREYGW